MDYRRINSHIVLLGMLIVVGLFAAIIVRMSMLESEADSGTANLIFVLILGASAVLYLIIISTLSNSLIPWIMKRLPAPKKKAGVANPDDLSEEYADEPDDEDSGEEETEPQIATAPPKIDWRDQHEREFRERLSPFREYTHFAMGPYVSEAELARLDGYVELFAREAPLPKDAVPIRPERLKNPDLYHFGWNMQNYFKVGKREDVVPWLQMVFTALKDLEFSTIKGKLHDPQTKRHTIPNIDDIPKFMAGKRS